METVTLTSLPSQRFDAYAALCLEVEIGGGSTAVCCVFTRTIHINFFNDCKILQPGTLVTHAGIS